MTNQLDTIRHIELFDPHFFNTPVTVIGAGATGSWLVLSLARLGITDITVWDFDVVESHNIPNQAFNLKSFDGDGHVGVPKVKALWDMVFLATGTQINIKNEKYTNQRLTGIVFLMVDSMSERKRIWEESIKMKPSVKLLIEPRMGLDVGRVYNVVPTDLNHIREYEKTYYSDDDAEVSACGASVSVISSSLGVASWCTRQLINFHNDVELDNEILIDFMYNNIITERW